MKEIVTQNNVQPPKKDHTTLITYGVLTLIVAIGIIIWFFYFRIDESKVDDFATSLQKDEELSKYFSEYLIIKNDHSETTNYEEYKLIPYIFSAYTTDEFNDMSIQEKQQITLKLVDTIDYQGWIRCGYNNKICDIQSLMVNSKDNDNNELFSYDFKTTNFQYGMYDGDDLEFVEIEDYIESDEDAQLTEQQLQDKIDENTKNPGNVRIGMTKEEVLTEGWGRPNDINKTTNAYGTSEQWVYDNYNYLYFDDGVLTSIQN